MGGILIRYFFQVRDKKNLKKNNNFVLFCNLSFIFAFSDNCLGKGNAMGQEEFDILSFLNCTRWLSIR
jgi:hypothetical protein